MTAETQDPMQVLKMAEREALNAARIED